MQIIFLMLASFACSASTATTTGGKVNRMEAKQMVNRLHEIKNIVDRKVLTQSEKASLRNEVLTIRQKLNDPLSGGVYISVGALILIIVLLILLL
jgi:hypothetical protein